MIAITVFEPYAENRPLHAFNGFGWRYAYPSVWIAGRTDIRPAVSTEDTADVTDWLSFYLPVRGLDADAIASAIWAQFNARIQA